MVISNQGRGLLIVGAGVTLLSFDSLLVRLMSIGPLAIVFWRGLFTAIGFTVLALLFDRSNGAFRNLGLAGVSIALFAAVSNFMFVVSLSKTSVAHTLVIFASAPVITAVMARLTIKERMAARTWVAAGVVSIGVGAIFWNSWGDIEVQGDLSALVGSIAVAGMLVVLRGNQKVNSLLALALGGLATALFVLPWVGHISLSVHDSIVTSVNGLIVLPVSVGLVSRGPRYIAASAVSLVMLLETVFGPVWVWLVLGERPTLQVVLSGALILGALATHSVLESRARKVISAS
jgi:drug/metabolite transporter (DMT)-like permease